MFVGLGQEKDTFLEEKTYNLFVGAKEKSKSSRLFTYMGSYSAKRVEPLSVQEWESLAPEVRDCLSFQSQTRPLIDSLL